MLILTLALSGNWRLRAVAVATGPQGACLRVLQKFEFGGEMFNTQVIYSNAAGTHRFYHNHQDSLWRARDTRIVNDGHYVTILRQGKPVIGFDWDRQLHINLRNGNTNQVNPQP